MQESSIRVISSIKQKINQKSKDMKIGKTFCTLVLTIMVASCVLTRVAANGEASDTSKLSSSFASNLPNLQTPLPKTPVKGTMPSGGDFQVPPNTTLLPPPPTMISFLLSLSNQNVTIHKGTSSTISLTVKNTDSLNATLQASLSQLSCVQVLPANTTIDFGTKTLVAPPNSTNNIDLTINVGNSSPLGTYNLIISAEQRVGMWTLGDSVPLELTIAS